jgi:6-pyruvoyl-tetrahydropterin synthase
MQLFVNNLTNIDFSYLCPDRGLVGETWLVNIVLKGPIDPQGMVCDFGKVKKTLRTWLDATLDHCLLVPNNAEAIQSHVENGVTVVQLELPQDEYIRVESPSQAITLLDVERITPATAAAWCINQIKPMFGDQITYIHLEFSPEVIDTPYYHYSHGLKKHQGQCQRIAHGHRSKLQIWRNSEPCIQSANEIASLWKDIYVGTRDDCDQDDGRHLSFSYEAAQGLFKLTVPKRSCYLIDSDTTVELIAQHFAETLGQKYPNDHIVVKAYEGVGKGAIAENMPQKPINI